MQQKLSELSDLIFKFYPLVRKSFRSLVSIKSLPISMTQLACLYTVEQQGDTTMGCLAKKLQMSNQQLTKVVDALCEFEMVTRNTDSGNRRRVLVCITPKGAKTLSSLRYEVVKKLSVLLEKLPEADVDSLYESMHAVDVVFEKIKTLL